VKKHDEKWRVRQQTSRFVGSDPAIGPRCIKVLCFVGIKVARACVSKANGEGSENEPIANQPEFFSVQAPSLLSCALPTKEIALTLLSGFNTFVSVICALFMVAHT
jgi:hypothetical protein